MVWRVCVLRRRTGSRRECTQCPYLLRSEARLVEIRSRRRRRLDGLELWQEALPRGLDALAALELDRDEVDDHLLEVGELLALEAVRVRVRVRVRVGVGVGTGQR